VGLADRRTQADNRTRFEKWLDSLNAKNRAVVESWLLDATIPIARIVEWIRDDDAEDDFRGYRVNKDTVSKWRASHGVG
jgi:hypothetical protein